MLNRAKPHVDMEKIIEYISKVDLLDEKHIIKFEKRFSNYLDARFCKAIDQGRDALFLALKILNISKGDEVIVQSFICKVVIDAILSSGAKPVLIDSSLDDFNVLPSEIKKKINSKTKAIIIAHLYGIPCNIDDIISIARENNCFLIEDCAQCINSIYKGKPVGTFGDISLFSFNFDKPLSTGKGGMIVINNSDLLSKSIDLLSSLNRLELKNDKKIVYGLFIQHLLTNKELYNDTLPIDFGQNLIKENHNLFLKFGELVDKNSKVNVIQNNLINFLNKKNIYINNKIIYKRKNVFLSGFNLAKKTIQFQNIKQYQHIKLMNSVRAITGLVELDIIDDVNAIRSKNSELYKKYLGENKELVLPVIDNNKIPVYLRYTVLNKTKHSINSITKIAKTNGFEVSNYNWSKPVHLIYPYNRFLKFKKSKLKNSEILASKIINLPVHYYVKDKDVIDITNILNSLDSL